MKNNLGKKSHNAEKKLKGRALLGVSNIHFVAKQQKIEGGPFGEFFLSGKKSQCRKN